MAIAPQAQVNRRKMAMVVVASSAGTVFEWYDFFIFGSLAAIIGKHFFASVGPTQALIFALLTFAAGFAVRPLGALVFGWFGDRFGRKRAFLVTITIMGLATFAIGFLPDYTAIGVVAPCVLVFLRVCQGFAVGGEYGGAAVYVAEHAGAHNRGTATGWVQVSATIGLLLALGIILAIRLGMGEDAFAAWGWRIPFIVSVLLLGLSLWIRLRLQESPMFLRIQAEGTASRAPIAEAFFRWSNLKIVLIALFGLLMGQGVVWYTAEFYTLFFLQNVIKVDPQRVNVLILIVTAAAAPLHLFFAWISDHVGRKPVMLFGLALAAISYFPGFALLTQAANPGLADAARKSPIVVLAAPSDCSIQFNLIGKATVVTSCDIAHNALTNAGVPYRTAAAPEGTFARVKVGREDVASPDGRKRSAAELAAARKDFDARLDKALIAAGYPKLADAKAMDIGRTLLILLVFIVAASALYGPQAAALVELFPTRIRYTAMSLPYHLGVGWFGGFLPATAFAIVAATGNIYAGLWYPVIVSAAGFVISLLFLPETYRRAIE
ncbi:MAG TPA: MFS transporter [Rhizomicrobium sp.]